MQYEMKEQKDKGGVHFYERKVRKRTGRKIKMKEIK